MPARATPPPASAPIELPGVVATLRAAGCVFAEDEAALLASAAATPAELAAMVERRAAGLPLEQVVGWAEFCGLRVLVDPGVFVPRRRTEFLVREAISRTRPGAVVVDLCTGAGAVGAALLAAVQPLQLHAVDIDPAAVRCARRNLTADVASVYDGDLYAALPVTLRGAVDVLVVNAPYVPTEAIALLPAEARLHEPLVALDGGFDGLDVHRRVAAEASQWLAPSGQLLIETSRAQSARTAEIVAEIVADSGLKVQVAQCDDLNTAVVIGTSS